MNNNIELINGMDRSIRPKSGSSRSGRSKRPSNAIGLRIVRALAREGVHLALASRSPDPKAIAELKGFGVDVLQLKADVSQEHLVNRMIAEPIAHFSALAHYVNNAAWE